jgi:hypothetical protein
MLTIPSVKPLPALAFTNMGTQESYALELEYDKNKDGMVTGYDWARLTDAQRRKLARAKVNTITRTELLLYGAGEVSEDVVKLLVDRRFTRMYNNLVKFYKKPSNREVFINDAIGETAPGIESLIGR